MGKLASCCGPMISVPKQPPAKDTCLLIFISQGELLLIWHCTCPMLIHFPKIMQLEAQGQLRLVATSRKLNGVCAAIHNATLNRAASQLVVSGGNVAQLNCLPPTVHATLVWCNRQPRVVANVPFKVYRDEASIQY